VVRPKVVETTALGAAYLAGLGVGYWKDAAEISRHGQTDMVFEPKMPRAEAQQLMAWWNEALARARDWAKE